MSKIMTESVKSKPSFNAKVDKIDLKWNLRLN